MIVLEHNSPSGRSSLAAKIIIRIFVFLVFFVLLLFLPAGSFRFWQAWVYIITLILPGFFVIAYFLRKDPDLLKRRLLQRHEKRKEQRSVQEYVSTIFLIGILIPGLDHRFQWSHVPSVVVLISDLFVLAGYLIFVRVMKENSYASSIIEITEDQKVIETGPYKIVRHPMYTAILILSVFTPVALGSYWALIPFLTGTPAVLVLRIRDEEKFLIGHLPGYREYCRKTRYRLVPFLW
jgi:protein-S-isoprenylcysteine O-methyltransferase Ste14